MNIQELNRIFEEFEKPIQRPLTKNGKNLKCVMCPPYKQNLAVAFGKPTNEPLCFEHNQINEQILKQRATLK
ncbi:MAG: hypothetical protein WC346_04410 [Methanogenium sp.]|jgi:hypothetical protein